MSVYQYSNGSLPDGSALVELQQRTSVNTFGHVATPVSSLHISGFLFHLLVFIYRKNKGKNVQPVNHSFFLLPPLLSVKPAFPARGSTASRLTVPIRTLFLLPKWEFAGNCPPGLFRFVLHSFQNKCSVSGLLYPRWLPCNLHNIRKCFLGSVIV